MSTRPCPQCGHPITDDARFCGQCGLTIETSGGSKTLLDHSPFGAAPENRPTDEKPAAKTLIQTLGDSSGPSSADDTAKRQIQIPDSALPSAAPTVAKPVIGTMLGMPAVSLPAQPPPSPADPGTPPPSQAVPNSQKTMLGVAIPGIAPAQSHVPAEPQNLANVNKPLGTLLGVAIPGIAPAQSHVPQPPANRQGTNIGMPSPMVNQPQGQPGSGRIATAMMPMPALPNVVPAPAPLHDEPLPDAPILPEKRGVPAVAVVLLVIVLVAVGGAAIALFVVRGGPAIAAAPQLDENGRESLKIKCETCPDGTTVALGASSAQVAAGNATLPLPAPLSIGDNDLDVNITKPGAGRADTVKVHVPVAYRVRADMATLSSRPPAITVRVESTAGSDVTVDGKPVALDSTGRGSYAIELSKDVEGTSDEQKTVEKKISFTIAAKGGKPEQGSLTARAAIVPLHLDAPGLVLYTDRSTVAVSGQTKTGGTLTIDGAQAPVDAQGRFGVRAELKDPGEKTLEIVAAAPPLAPRIVHAKAIKVASLEDAAKDLESKGPLAYDAFAATAADKIGQAVAVDGDVVEARSQQGYCVLLVDQKKCPSGKGGCLVRLVHGEDTKTARGDTVRAYGTLIGTVAAGGKTVPDIEASLLIVKGAGTK